MILAADNEAALEQQLLDEFAAALYGEMRERAAVIADQQVALAVIPETGARWRAISERIRALSRLEDADQRRRRERHEARDHGRFDVEPKILVSEHA